MANFLKLLEKTVNNLRVTENGAFGYATTHAPLLDMYYFIPEYRYDYELLYKNLDAMFKDKEPFVLRFLLMLRDPRNGLGERDSFRDSIKYFFTSNNGVKNKDELFDFFLENIPNYGRYDDIFIFLGTKYEEKVIEFVRKTLKEDYENYHQNKAISLLSKWMPSCNTSSEDTRKLAKILIKGLNTNYKDYRKLLSTLRKYSKVIEPLMCANKWERIDYNQVPSNANRIYADAFLRHDEKRRLEYIHDLANGKKGVKMNSSVNFPHDVLHMYAGPYLLGVTVGKYNASTKYDEVIEQLWKNLKDIGSLKNTIVVRDDSGSMGCHIPKTNVTAYEIATALAIYAAERLPKPYKNKIITFSRTPKYLDFSNESKYSSLYSKYMFLNEHSEYLNTNIEAVFDLILNTAIENNLTQEQIPQRVLIISDMEFDSASEFEYGKTLFKTIKKKYELSGYKLPKLVFWNLFSRSYAIPAYDESTGVTLLSGFSINSLELLNSDELSPLDALLEMMAKEIYESIPLVEYEDIQPESDGKVEKMEKPKFLE